MALHESLAQRLIVQHHLRGLQREEPEHYLAHRLRLTGCEVPLFEPPAAEAQFQGARGMPRIVNRIAHYAESATRFLLSSDLRVEHNQLVMDLV
ncbi:MAG: hypothetical protein OXE50_14435 [Chloroflexi bacterium]|nr:hypothetical protein [Chloroflexota bacterium]